MLPAPPITLHPALCVSAPPPQIINETLPALQQLKQQGLVRFIGITGLPFKCLTHVLDRVPPGVCVC